MPEDTGTKPAQFRLPAWAHGFIKEEAAKYGTTKTGVVLKALETLKQQEFEELLKEGYIECAEENAREVGEWFAASAEVWEQDEW
jgi:hypothetical protein